ncbi:BZ3500_MvSof-1268-A1-R1_Chr5-2g07910 [Microbotryum saponariae]|uniref:BZ3500_MvSof-1268-A1-R1_Chr5-2g07910 protein n=1 Tax=Microbotryum saponariae TaxID=289078 RepID=A0A2X0KG19_9BASI|nr:BZ3500_MvSof-1268-A1-R1_Chr5-2g07910 [Microbotryum saponariae]SDA05779.1 BZ3501_MvSof-1269-A2-R1_Chr5-2g07732 [Microbotryum saponariae]
MPTPPPDVPLHHLIERAILLEKIDRDLYRSKELWKPSGGRGVFGGQTIAQSAWAATLSVRDDEPGTAKGLHSLHSYFLSFGNVDNPILYSVQRLRDGRSYSTRTVLATQLGVPIFVVTCSFAVPEPNQPITEPVFPKWPLEPSRGAGRIQDIPPPEECLSTEDRLQYVLDNVKVPEKLRVYVDRQAEERRQSAIEVRNADRTELSGLISAKKNDPRPQQMHWFRSRAPVRDDPAFHKVRLSSPECVLAYASDLQFIGTAARAANLGARTTPRLGMLASLDHAMYFYDDTVDAYDWLLFYMEATVVRSGRGLVTGRIYKRDGTLAVVCQQEGVVRAQL